MQEPARSETPSHLSLVSSESVDEHATTHTEAPSPADLERMPPDELVRRVHAGDVNAESMPAAARRRCVGHLTAEGFTCAEIMHLMRLSDRTIRRDRAAVRRSGARRPSRTLGDELLGEFERVVQGCTQRLMRLARDPDTPPYARLWAEEAIVRMHQRLIDTTHKLNYLAEGGGRLEYERETDPDEFDRHCVQLIARRERSDAMIRSLTAIKPRLFHAPADDDAGRKTKTR